MISRYELAVLAALSLASPASAQTVVVGQPGSGAEQPGVTLSEAPGLTIAGRIEPGRPGGYEQDRDAQERERDAREREREAKDRDRQRAQAERDRENAIYEQGTSALWESRWDRALAHFTRLAELRGSRADAALYWKAYAQNRLGQRAESLATLSELLKTHPTSGYIRQAKALQVEAAGQTARPESQNDDELKLIALNGLAQSNSPEAIPLIENLLNGTASPALKSRALFVLAQINSPRSREVLKSVAKGSSIPELQGRAIQYLGQQGGAESRALLAEIYASSTDVDVKRRILRAFMAAGERDRLFAAAQSETNAELREEAIRQLGAMGANDMLWQMYQKESSVELKGRIISALQVGGNATRMIEIAKTEKDPDLRRAAVRNLGIMGSKPAGDALVELYNVEKDENVRRTIINGLAQQGNATALVAMARKEQDIAMKTEIVKRLSNMGNNAVAKAYLLELLK